ncbi:MAG TPA: DUF2145 domain-containing protein [Burkholderiaceae bacterium]|nr:DUF2145 domain-containing protein [Burkholderiaceae bacterium]
MSWCRAVLRAMAALLLLHGAATAAAGSASPTLCDRAPALGAREQDAVLRFAAVAREALERSDARVALVSRSGLNLARFGIRHSHAGFALRDGPLGAWSVRQLYYACSEGRPRLFDQGLPGFAFGTDDPALGYLSIVLLPAAAAEALERHVRDAASALPLLAGAYSANAYAFGLRYQNCNQWVAELMASAWGGLDPQADAPRARAQAWLREAGYAPPPVEVDSRPLMFAAAFVPWVHTDDHPEEDVLAMRFRTSLPAALEAFVRARWPEARRLELCHDTRQVVLREGWTPIADGCRAEPGDRVIALD